VWLSSCGTGIVEITKTTPDPAGGSILRDAHGEATGILLDTAIHLITDKLPVSPDEDKLEMWQVAENAYFKFGLTSITDAGSGVTYGDVKLFKKYYANGDLKIRNYSMMDAGEDIKYIEDGNSPVVGLYGNRLSFNAVKVIGDGSFGSQTAWMSKDYTFRKDYKVLVDIQIRNFTRLSRGSEVKAFRSLHMQ
jgi:predicted amidohydrolase YtcJ